MTEPMIAFHEGARLFHLSAPGLSYVIGIDEDNRLVELYWGPPLSETNDGLDLSYLMRLYPEGASFEMKPIRRPYLVPSIGYGWYGSPAVQAVNDQGDNMTDLRYVSHEILHHKPALEGLPSTHVSDTGASSEVPTLVLHLEDALTHLQAALFFSLIGTGEHFALARHMELTNEGSAPLTLTHMASAQSAVPAGQRPDQALQVLHLKGAWARERQIVRTAAGEAAYRIESQKGASSHYENPFLALVRKSTTEDTGDVYAMNFVYSGSFEALCETPDAAFTFLQMGLNSAVHQWRLEPSGTFVTPEVVQVYSSHGLNGMSHIYHDLYRHCLGNSLFQHRARPLLLNSWEGLGITINEQDTLQLARQAKELGVDMLVLDDGWFANRNDDKRSLGDWYPSPEKFPHGLKWLAEKVREEGLLFGLWMEPEMISPDSDLYRSHPDWCLHVDGRERSLARTQLILDLSRREVQDYLIQTIENVLNSAPISYLKWDYNRNMTEPFSSALPPERKMESQHRYMLGLYRVLGEVTAAFPQVLFESCSGGGGRFDAGMLSYMCQTWTSDDTDAYERLKIQYGTSLVYPASCMVAHISDVPNSQTGRRTPLKTRAYAAMGGCFGLEIDPGHASDSEKEEIRKYVEEARSLQKIAQEGELDRLISPFGDSNMAAWQFSLENEVLVYAFRRLSLPNTMPVRLCLTNLPEQTQYEDEEGHRYSGGQLMHAGLVLRFDGQDFDAVRIHLKKV